MNYAGEFFGGERGENLGELVLIGDIGAKDAYLRTAGFESADGGNFFCGGIRGISTDCIPLRAVGKAGAAEESDVAGAAFDEPAGDFEAEFTAAGGDEVGAVVADVFAVGRGAGGVDEARDQTAHYLAIATEGGLVFAGGARDGTDGRKCGCGAVGGGGGRFEIEEAAPEVGVLERDGSRNAPSGGLSRISGGFGSGGLRALREDPEFRFRAGAQHGLQSFGDVRSGGGSGAFDLSW